MWNNLHKDYRKDDQWHHEWVEPGTGISGCEMHEINGWQDTIHIKPPRKPGFLHTLRALFTWRGRSEKESP